MRIAKAVHVCPRCFLIRNTIYGMMKKHRTMHTHREHGQGGTGMEWTSLLSTEKLAVEPEEPAVFRVYPINAFEKDYRKIVSSAAFRRLQDKT